MDRDGLVDLGIRDVITMYLIFLLFYNCHFLNYRDYNVNNLISNLYITILYYKNSYTVCVAVYSYFVNFFITFYKFKMLIKYLYTIIRIYVE